MELLSRRLKTALSMLEPCRCLADIGSDHGYLIVSAIKTGVARRGVAVEINRPPYEQTLRTVELYGLTDSIDVRLGDGLQPLRQGEADALVVAGMGGGTIAGILATGRDRLGAIRQLILQPNVDAAQLRTQLLRDNFVIVDELLVEDGDFIYQVIKAQPGQETQEYSALELEYGRIILKGGSILLNMVIKRDILHWEKVLSELNKAKSEDAVHKRGQIERRIRELKEVQQ